MRLPRSTRARAVAREHERTIATENRARVHFDDDYYRETYDDVADPQFDRFRHFMDHGWREGRNPSAVFDALYYRDVHLHGSLVNPLIHFTESGEALGLATRCQNGNDDHLEVQRALCRTYFSDSEYRRLSGYSGDDAMAFYLRFGWRQGVAPSLLFDPIDYIAQHQFLTRQDVSPLYHCASQRRARGESAPLSPDLHVEPAPEALTYRVDAPTRDLKPPKLVELEPVPEPIRGAISAIWQSEKTGGQPVSAFHFKDVFVTGEGLIFTDEARLISVTKTMHSERSMREEALAIAKVRAEGSFKTIEKGIVIENRGARNYGHFILEMLSRAWFARTQLGCRWPAIIHGGDSPIEQVARQALRFVGYPTKDIVTVGREPIFVGELCYVDGLARHPLYISPTVLQCFDEIAGQIPRGAIGKIYAARGMPNARDFSDEASAAATMAAHGFHRVTTGAMSFKKQVALFTGASHVVGVSGAALTNLLFCRPGTRVTVFSPASASEVLFWMIAELRGLDYTEVRCREIGPQLGSLTWDRAIDIPASQIARLLAL